MSEATESNSLYAERDIERLDEMGGYYFKHVSAMTSEDLHSKREIAAELGWRDAVIDILLDSLDEKNRQHIFNNVIVGI